MMLDSLGLALCMLLRQRLCLLPLLLLWLLYRLAH
jgi:hypothetical protein